ncbi:MAG: Rap1a/Tai family immunity protein [Alphaproteobacteria bacterium]
MIRQGHLLVVLAAAVIAGGVLVLPDRVAAITYTDYTVRDLLAPCFEGDSDSRWGETFEVNCEQYIRGFSDAYFHFSAQGAMPRICFPEGANRLDLIRWAFIKWARQNTDKQDWPAAQGLVAAVNAEMACE